MTLHLGDCRAVMADMAPESIDAIVTDPPYGLSFMGKAWDHGVPGIPFWTEALRVLKPGGYLLAFGGTRTYHRLAVAIEDSGFEIRDTLMFLHGQGFPKNHSVGKALDKSKMRCTCEGSAVQYNHENVSREGVPSLRKDVATSEPLPVSTKKNVWSEVRGSADQFVADGTTQQTDQPGDGKLRDMRQVVREASGVGQAGDRSLLQPPMQWQAESQDAGSVLSERQGQEATGQGVGGTGQPGVEGRRDVLPQARELQADQVRAVPDRPADDGAAGRICDGTSPPNGANDGVLSHSRGGGASPRPQSSEQLPQQSGTVANEQQPQASGAWPDCPRCGLPMVPEGLGTALKPSYEPIIMARKPLARGHTVAANVLEYGTGAINVDACRIEHGNEVDLGRRQNQHADSSGMRGIGEAGYKSDHTQPIYSDKGRWPANVVLDEGAAAMLDAQSEGTRASKPSNTGSGFKGEGSLFQITNHTPVRHDGSGASRFFYCPKASRAERNRGLEGMEDSPSYMVANGSKTSGLNGQRYERHTVHKNTHPTVKPLALMRWLVRMVTQPGGIVLDPFMGSGSTGVAAIQEGFQFIGIDLDPDYLEIARRRIAHAQQQGRQVAFESA